MLICCISSSWQGWTRTKSYPTDWSHSRPPNYISLIFLTYQTSAMKDRMLNTCNFIVIFQCYLCQYPTQAWWELNIKSILDISNTINNLACDYSLQSLCNKTILYNKKVHGSKNAWHSYLSIKTPKCNIPDREQITRLSSATNSTRSSITTSDTTPFPPPTTKQKIHTETWYIPHWLPITKAIDFSLSSHCSLHQEKKEPVSTSDHECS